MAVMAYNLALQIQLMHFSCTAGGDCLAACHIPVICLLFVVVGRLSSPVLWVLFLLAPIDLPVSSSLGKPDIFVEVAIVL
jgi:hypothetical protein